jgi:hypothetical protein
MPRLHRAGSSADQPYIRQRRTNGFGVSEPPKRTTPIAMGDYDSDGCSIVPEIICEPSWCIMADASATASAAWVCSAAGPNSRITITFAWCRYVSAREMAILDISSRSGFDMGAPPTCKLSREIFEPAQSSINDASQRFDARDANGCLVRDAVVRCSLCQWRLTAR